jgi:hypothetical protein
MIFGKIEKNTYPTTYNLLALGKIDAVARINTRAYPLRQSKMEGCDKRIRSRTALLIQMYMRERKYKNSYGDP